MKKSLVVLVVTSVLIGWVASAAAAFCWEDNFGGTMSLEIGPSPSGAFALFGKQIFPDFVCQTNTRTSPVSGVAIVEGGKAFLSLWTFHDGPGCIPTAFHMTVDLATLMGNGILTLLDPSFAKFSVTWTPKPCS